MASVGDKFSVPEQFQQIAKDQYKDKVSYLGKRVEILRLKQEKLSGLSGMIKNIGLRKEIAQLNKTIRGHDRAITAILNQTQQKRTTQQNTTETSPSNQDISNQITFAKEQINELQKKLQPIQREYNIAESVNATNEMAQFQKEMKPIKQEIEKITLYQSYLENNIQNPTTKELGQYADLRNQVFEKKNVMTRSNVIMRLGHKLGITKAAGELKKLQTDKREAKMNAMINEKTDKDQKLQDLKNQALLKSQEHKIQEATKKHKNVNDKVHQNLSNSIDAKINQCKQNKTALTDETLHEMLEAISVSNEMENPLYNWDIRDAIPDKELAASFREMNKKFENNPDDMKAVHALFNSIKRRENPGVLPGKLELMKSCAAMLARNPENFKENFKKHIDNPKQLWPWEANTMRRSIEQNFGTIQNKLKTTLNDTDFNQQNILLNKLYTSIEQHIKICDAIGHKITPKEWEDIEKKSLASYETIATEQKLPEWPIPENLENDYAIQKKELGKQDQKEPEKK